MQKSTKKNEIRKGEIVEPSIERKSMDLDVKIEAKKELGGPKGPEPTRYGDWESKGRCYDF